MPRPGLRSEGKDVSARLPFKRHKRFNSVNGPQLRDGLQDRIRSIKDYGKYKSDLKTEGFFNIF